MAVERSWLLAGWVLLLLFLAAGCMDSIGPRAPRTVPIAGETADVLYFWGEGCHACHGVTPFVEELAREHPRLRFDLVETYGNETNTSRYYAVNRELNITPRGLPEAVADGHTFFGEAEIRSGLRDAVRAVEARR